jgi:hypothetical protein
MPTITRRLCVALLAASIPLAGASAPTPESDCPSRTTRDELNLGYSMLHEQTKDLANLKWLLLLKNDTETFEHTVKPIVAYYKRVASKLEALRDAHPKMRIDLQALPRFLGEARKSMVSAKVDEIKPITGVHGTPYERNVLLMLMYALDEQREILAAMSLKETEPQLRTFLLETHEELGAYLQKVNALLRKRYFAGGAKPD